ncbi:amino acid adenylation domain-containing protein [Pseudobutyrivibrio sp.]|uniref:amino acid adenylation domain-containing protein n=1 Tax=Pseudobutyrivibrio sp. TaxID=2014367 RepID=UPI0025DF2103|nr:amino acid adenylation domain-containing protein [Pseudobutyrivibrio sp.]
MERYPLTQTQLGIYFDWLKFPDSTIYNIPCLYELDTEVDMQRLADALCKVVEAHPCLSVTFEKGENGDIFAVKNIPAVSSYPVKNYEPKLEELVRPFDLLSREPLYRFDLFDYEGRKSLFIDTHHIISDGSSISILLDDINDAYDKKTLAAEKYTGFDRAVDEEKMRNSPQYQVSKSWYDSILKGCDAVTLPLYEKTDSTETIATDERQGSISAEVVRNYCAENNVTTNAFFTSAFGLALKAYTGSESAIFATIYNGRIDPRLERSVSMFVKTLPVLLVADREKSVLSYVEECQSYLVNAMVNDIVSFAEIHRDYGISADVLFAYQGERKPEITLCGGKALETELPVSQAKAPFGLDIALMDDAILYSFEYDPACYSIYTINGFCATLDNVIAEMLKKEKLSDISLVTKEQEDTIKNLYDTAFVVKERPAYRLLQDAAAANPSKTALIAADRSLTYGELNEEANCVGHMLRENGVAPESIVAVVADRNSFAYVMRQGVLKGGGAFLPIDPEYPQERISFILKDSGAKLIITENAILERRAQLFESVRRTGITVISVEDAIAEYDKSDLNVDVPYDALAYVIYTSGSTGTPKGVMLTNKNLVNFVDDNEKNHEIRGYTQYGHTSLAIAALTFDFSVMEEFVPLANGMTVVLATHEEIMDPYRISQLMIQNHVDVMSCTPGYIMNMLDMEVFQKAVYGLKAIDLGAEAFPAALFTKLTEIVPDIHIMNGYGPTEATISCTMKVITENDNITIGMPNVNVKAATIDRDGRLQIPGAVGELVILGDGVGRGYIGRDDLTQKCFIKMLGMRAYRTGDLVRILPDGQIEYHGRIDNQVKLRGLRVELGEIESVLNSYPGIRSSIVIVAKRETEYLAAYFTADNIIDIDLLKKHLSSKLTAYMVPQAFMQLDEMPLTANGKIDKKSLPEIKGTEPNRILKKAETRTEKKILALFKKTLGLENIGIDESFFELGGTSLTAARLMMAAITDNIPIVFQDVFNNPTVEKLSKLVEEKFGEESVVTEASAEKQEELEKKGDLSDALRYNNARYVDEIKPGTLKNVLVTGATGFLGMHIVNELLYSDVKKIFCLVRKGRGPVQNRLASTFFYYFDEYEDKINDDRIVVIEGDITDDKCMQKLEGLDFDTVINCAACVKHFADPVFLKHINVYGVDNLIALCTKKKARLVQMSTVSVAGDNLKGMSGEGVLTEERLEFGQDVESNSYVYSKYLAEQHILSAIASGELDGKIIRLGNLMSRHVDGEFQINFRTNNFMNTIRAYVFMKSFPMQQMDEVDELSPIDEVAKAVVLLASVDRKFTVFHAYNSHTIEMGDIIEALKESGFDISVIDETDFNRRLKEAVADEKRNQFVAPLVDYNLDDDEIRSENEISNAFTVKALYRLGFKWSITDKDYLKKATEMLKTLGFFES